MKGGTSKVSRVNVGVLENIIRTLFSALSVSKMNSTEIDSVINNLVDENASEEVSNSSPVLVEHSGNKPILSGNFEIIN